MLDVALNGDIYVGKSQLMEPSLDSSRCLPRLRRCEEKRIDSDVTRKIDMPLARGEWCG